ncbi:MAG: DNA-directed RNA polymerase subunit gamma, partial [Moorea sp. SIO3G5]|nr:DNA-directed RNA polymerase subunit gamma [Moorena sp. SIO3G5]
LASNNILSPATGRPIIAPSQDMVLGCYYLTAKNPKATKGAGRYFANLEDAIKAYEQKQVHLHAYIWVRYDGIVDTDEPDKEMISEESSPDGMVTKVYKNRRVRETADGELISQYIRTTAGRIIYNKTIQEALWG